MHILEFYLQVDIVLHESHSGISRPAFLIVVADNIFIVRIRMLRQVPLYQITGFFGSESEK